MNIKKKESYFVKLPINIRLKLIFLGSKFLVLLIQVLPTIVISVSTIFIFINQYANITQTTRLFNDPTFTGLLGTLIGTFVGAFVAGIISFQLHTESTSSASAIKNKEEIYKVLYDGLVKFKFEITPIKDRYFTYFIYEESDIRFKITNAKFIEWDQIKNDSRIIQTPKWVKSIFKTYFLSFTRYKELIDIATTDIITIKTKLSEEVGLHYRSIGSDETYLIGLMNQNNFYTSHALQFQEDGDLKDVDLNDLAKRVESVCLRLSSVENAKSFYDNVLIKNTDQIISILELIIQYVNHRYENQEDII